MTKAKKFRDYNPKQVILLPPSLSDWLRPGHPVYFVSEVVDGFDLSAIYQGYAELRGYPPYEPGMMVKLWLYGLYGRNPLLAEAGAGFAGLTHEVIHAVLPQYRLDSPIHQLAGELLTDLAAEALGRSLAAPGYRGFKPLDGFAERWDGWKLSYGSDLGATADTARARAVEVWDAYASSGEAFEDAIDRLAAALLS